MKKKKFTKKFPWEFKESKDKICDQENCYEIAMFKAPKSVNSKNYYYFCKEHIKIYNKRWNFFAGKSQNEIYNYLKNEMYINKPTRPISDRISSKIKFDFSYIFENNYNYNKKSDNNDLVDDLSAALTLFKLKQPFSMQELKKSYKELVKKNHPDVHGGDINKDSLLKKINNYYKNLKKVAN